MENKAIDLFYEKLENAINNSDFVKLIVSKKSNKSSNCNKVTIVPVKIKDELKMSFRQTLLTNDITKNYEISQTIQYFKKIESDFLNFDLFTTQETIQLFKNKKGKKSTLKISEPVFTSLPDFDHDKIKKKRIQTKNNIYLKELGITNQEGNIKKDMHDKFRQINKYLEIFESLISKMKLKDKISIVDMGSGKGYLTFALYDFLTTGLNLKPNVYGVEFRQELVDKCNETSKKCNFENLSFINGSIDTTDFENIDILIALHACDTATDDAIFKGIKSNADLIIVAPCCQKQIRKQMNVSSDFASIVKFGILKERQAVILTDGIRALLLEAYGYNTKVFEFISTEHTAKNIMITAELSKKPQNKELILDKINSIKSDFGIKYHYLEKLLKI